MYEHGPSLLNLVRFFAAATDSVRTTVAAEGSTLGLFKYDELLSKKEDGEVRQFDGSKLPHASCSLIISLASTQPLELLLWGGEEESKQTQWRRGQTLGQAQNLARTLANTPANLMTPSLFVKKVEEQFTSLSHVNIVVHDK